MKICIIGAGPSGLTTLKTLLENGFKDIVVYEKNDDIGGNWYLSENNNHSSAYETLNIITSKKMSSFSDFPMPDNYPDYPPHWLVLEYFKNYAKNFNLYDYIRFNSEVIKVRRISDYNYEIVLKDGKVENYNVVIVCNGHHWDPYIPKFEGEFKGEIIHSHYYKNPNPFKGKKVLIVGAGNSACDIAVDICRINKNTAISIRRGYYFIPKFALFGIPSDYFHSKIQFLPKNIRKLLIKSLLKVIVGDLSKYGMPKPDHDLFQTHPIVNSELVYYIKHGRIKIRPEIFKLDGYSVIFKNGISEEYEIIILATGYKISFPFFDENFKKTFLDGYKVKLFLNIFHPNFRDIFFVGLIQPDGCLWVLSELQAKLISKFLKGDYKLPNNILEVIESQIKEQFKKYLNTPRHSIEVDFYKYKQKIMKLISSKN